MCCSFVARSGCDIGSSILYSFRFLFVVVEKYGLLYFMVLLCRKSDTGHKNLFFIFLLHSSPNFILPRQQYPQNWRQQCFLLFGSILTDLQFLERPFFFFFGDPGLTLGLWECRDPCPSFSAHMASGISLKGEKKCVGNPC